MKKLALLSLALLLMSCGCVQEQPTVTTSSTIHVVTSTSAAQTTAVTSSTFPTITSSTQPTGKFTVHEWGVLSGQSLDAAYSLSSAPAGATPTTLPDLPVVKEPVIYVHSESKESFDVAVVFRNGQPTDTYPVAESDASSVTWKNVQIAEDNGKEPTYPSGILKTINNVDADLLQYMGHKSRSLFYEGEVKFENQVRMIYNADKREALIENAGSYPIYDVLLIVPQNYNKLLGKNIYADVITKIGAGEKVTVPLKQVPAKADYTEELTRQGFTKTEAEAFANIWQNEFTKTEKGNGNLVYRLSQEEYESLISLKITPEPEKTIRSLYVFVRLTGKDAPAPPVIGTGFGIYQGQDEVISEDGIISYNQTNHEIKLNEEGLRVMRSKILYEEENGQLVPKLGGLYLKTFTVRLNGEEIYSGTFWSSLSSSSNDGVVLLDVLGINSGDSIRLEAGYPSSAYFKGIDPRNNTKIMQYLKEKGKLVE